MKTITIFLRIPATISGAKSLGSGSQVRHKSDWLVVLTIFCCLAHPLTAEQFGKFTYLDTGDEITITDYSNEDLGPVLIPANIAGKPVTQIGDSAFHDCSGLTSVTIPSNVRKISNYAFCGCGNLSSVILESGLVTIDQGAFQSCTALTSITIPPGVLSIGDSAFNNCTVLTNAAIPASIGLIGEGAFSSCSALTSISVDAANPYFSSLNGVLFDKLRTQLLQCPAGVSGEYAIPLGVITIGNLAFCNCSALTAITLPSSVLDIGNSAFSYCSELKSIELQSAVRSIGKNAFEACKCLASVTLPTGVSNIEEWTFAGCHGLTSMTIPTSVVAIGNGAFYECRGLTSLTIPENVEMIGDNAISGCSRLISISVDSANPNFSSANGVLFNRTKTRLVQCPAGLSGDYVIPPDVKTIGNSAFYECEGLSSVTIPTSVTSIENAAFYGCRSLTSITIPYGVIRIGVQTFIGCGLTSVMIPSTVTSIGMLAFASCDSLANVTLPDSVVSIEDEAFSGCRGLTGVSLSTSLTSIGEWAFSGCGILPLVEFPSGVTSIGRYAFEGCTALTDAIFTGNAPSMGTGVFDSTATDFTVYFFNGRTGFTTPMWMGYPAVATGPVLSPEIAIEEPAGANLVDGGSSVTFSSVSLGLSRNITLTIKNTGHAELTGLKVNVDGADAEDFSVTNKPVAPVSGPCGTTSFTVAFKPTVAGNRTAAIHITSNDTDESPFDITLTGKGIPSSEISVQQPAGKNLTDGVSSISFGSLEVKSKVSITFAVKNTGTAKLKNLAVTKTGTNTGDFTIKPLLKTTLAHGAKTTFMVIFKPSAKGTRKAVIHIRSNDRDENPFDITVTGKGIASHSNTALAETTISAHGIFSNSHDRVRSVASTMRIHGKRHRCITIFRTGTSYPGKESVEVSSNLVDWFSGSIYTTVIEDNAELLKVRDNTPIGSGNRRFIRIRTAPTPSLTSSHAVIFNL